MNVIEKIFGIIIAIAVMFVFPVIWAENNIEKIQRDYIEQLTEEFNNTICTKGYIGKNTYQVYMTSVNCINSYMSINLCVCRRIVEPEYENGTFTGEVFEYDDKTYNSEILDKIEEKGKYDMQKGDVVCIEVFSRNEIYLSVVDMVTGKERR